MIGTALEKRFDIIYGTNGTPLGVLLEMFIIAASHFARSVDACQIGKPNC